MKPETARQVPLSVKRRCFHWTEQERRTRQGEDRLRPEPLQPQGLVGNSLHGYHAIRRRDHPAVWQSLGHRGVFQDL